MQKLHSIPFIFGVTGHRDLRDEDIASLEASVRGLLLSYQSRYPHTQLIVISALAEGADMLVARVAVDLGLTLHVLIPYQEEEYLNSFMDRDNNEAEYRRLKESASRFEVHSCVHTYGAENCYQQLGEQIADTSNMLIALWNQKEEKKDNGGTAAIVRYQRDGFGDNMFDARDGNAIYIVNAPRLSDVETIENLCVSRMEYLGMMDGDAYGAMLHKLDETNAEMTQHIWTQEQKEKIKNKPLLFQYKTYFDTLANEHQNRYQKYMVLVLVLTGLGILSLELMHSFSLVDA